MNSTEHGIEQVINIYFWIKLSGELINGKVLKTWEGHKCISKIWHDK